MSFKAGFLLIALLAGSYAFPAKDDTSIVFDRTDSSARVIGGRSLGTIPYIIALVSGLSVRNLMCGGSLVTTRHVLTAAHCIESATSDNNLISSLRGIVDTYRFDRFGTAYSFSGRIVHQDYNARTSKNDIGLLVTSSNVVLIEWRVTLAALNFDFVGAGVETTIAGYGISSTGSVSRNLLRMNATVLEGEVCRDFVRERAQGLRLFSTPPVDPELEICTYHSYRSGACTGDFGGPLIHAERNEQIGILSWGVGRCAPNAPDMSVRLSAFRSWIEQNTREV